MTYQIFEVSDKIPFCTVEADSEKEALLIFQSSRCVSNNGILTTDDTGRLILKKNHCWWIAIRK